MTSKKAWDYAIGLIKVDGLEPTSGFKKVHFSQEVWRNYHGRS